MARERVAGALYESIPGQLFEIWRQLRQSNGYPYDLVALKNHLQAAIEGRFGSDVRSVANILTDWQKFYAEVFDLALDLSNLRIPEKREGFDRLIVMVPGLTPELIWAKIQGTMPCWKYWPNLDQITSERNAGTAPYALWVRDRQEADEELKNLSANQLKEQGIPGITLEERLIFELKYFKETQVSGQAGQHLDVHNWTLCAGSRDPSGRVPDVRWDDGRLRVDWCSADGRYDSVRARAVVS